MEYSLVVAPSLETLAAEVAIFFPKGWKLKGSILEHNKGYAQQLIRQPSDSIRAINKTTNQTMAIISKPEQPKRTKWIE